MLEKLRGVKNVNEVIEGLSRFGDTQLYVTRGAGYWDQAKTAAGPNAPPVSARRVTSSNVPLPRLR